MPSASTCLACHRLGLVLSAMFAATILHSQESQREADDSYYELSPFVVDAKDDRGYRAATTLAGTRLNTEIRDLGSAISVLTEELFEDTGATDAGSILSYALSAEVTGVQGNFSGAVTGAGTPSLGGVRRQPQAEGQRIRGLGQASLTRDYFLTDIPFDSYNTDRVTINRGPNSLLFGVGEPGGIINNSVRQASLGSSFGEIGFRFGERGSNRQTIDVNRVVVENRLAVRVAGLREKEKYQQRPAFEEDERLYFAFMATIFRNKESEWLGQTRLRGNYEDGTIESTPPAILPPSDHLSDWFETPSRNIEAHTGTPLPSYVDDGSFTPKYTVDGRPGLIPEQIPASVLAGPYWINLGYIFENPLSPEPGLSGTSLDGYMFRILYNGQPRNRFDKFRTMSLIGQQPGFATPSISPQVVDNENLLISGNLDQVAQDFDAINLTLEQSFFNRKAGIEIAFDRQSYGNDSVLVGRQLRVDVDEYIQVGQAGDTNGDMPNPNLGRVYIDANPWGTFKDEQVDREAIRATAYYELDFTSGDRSAWLGRHIFTALRAEQKIDRLSQSRQPVWIDDGSVDIQELLFANKNGARRKAPAVFYLTPPLHNDDGVQSVTDVRINDFVHALHPEPGDRRRFSYWNRTRQQFGVDEFELERTLLGGDRTRRRIDSQAISWQSYFLGGKIVGLLGYREDDTEGYERLGNDRLPDGSFDPANLQLDLDDPSLDSGDTVTWSVVGHLPWKLPQETRVSLHYGESENFSPQGIRRNIFGQALASPSGRTEEVGITFDLFNSALVARLNWFETSRDGADAEIGNVVNRSHSWVGAWLGRWREAEDVGTSIAEALAFVSEDGALGTAPADWTSYNDVYAEIIGFLPPEIQSLFNYRFEGGNPVSDPIGGLTATKSFVTEGFELDLTGQLSPNWRIALNVGKQETVQSGTAPAITEFVLGPNGFWQALQASPLADYWDSPERGKERSFANRYAVEVVNPLVAALAKDGTVSAEQRKWRVNLATNYLFPDDSPLSGVGVGGAVRWQDQVATGYRQIPGEGGLVSPDLSHPHFGPEELNGDLWLSYERSVLRDKAQWKIQLNVRNAFGDDDPIPVVTNPDGRVAVIRNPNPREAFITNTLAF